MKSWFTAAAKVAGMTAIATLVTATGGALATTTAEAAVGPGNHSQNVHMIGQNVRHDNDRDRDRDRDRDINRVHFPDRDRDQDRGRVFHP